MVTSQGPILTNVNEGVVINNLFVPSIRTTNYGLKQLKVNGHRIEYGTNYHLI